MVGPTERPRDPSEIPRKKEDKKVEDPDKFKKVMAVEKGDEAEKRKKRHRTKQAEEGEEEDAPQGPQNVPTGDFSALMGGKEKKPGLYDTQETTTTQGPKQVSRPEGPSSPSLGEFFEENLDELQEPDLEWSHMGAEPPAQPEPTERKRDKEKEPVQKREETHPEEAVAKPTEEPAPIEAVSKEAETEEVVAAGPEKKEEALKHAEKEEETEEPSPAEVEAAAPTIPEEAKEIQPTEEESLGVTSVEKEEGVTGATPAAMEGETAPAGRVELTEEEKKASVEKAKEISTPALKKWVGTKGQEEQEHLDYGEKPFSISVSDKPETSDEEEPSEAESVKGPDALKATTAKTQAGRAQMAMEEEEEEGISPTSQASAATATSATAAIPGQPAATATAQATAKAEAAASIAASAKGRPISKLSPRVFEIVERMSGIIQIEKNKEGDVKTSIKVNMPGSVFHGSEIIVNKYAAQAGKLNVQLQGSPEAVALFNNNLSDITAALKGGKIQAELEVKPASISEETEDFTRKSATGEDDQGSADEE